MSEFHEGDLVEAVKGETVIRGRAIPHFTGKLAPGECTASLSWYEANGFTVTVIEKAAPPLPTEPGHYEDALGRHWLHQTYDGSAYGAPDRDVDRWFNPDGVVENPTRIAGTLSLTKLEPVPVTARRVLDDVIARTTMHCNACAGRLAEIREEYGAAS